MVIGTKIELLESVHVGDRFVREYVIRSKYEEGSYLHDTFRRVLSLRYMTRVASEVMISPSRLYDGDR